MSMHPEHAGQPLSGTPLSRRQLLKGLMVAGAGATLLSACIAPTAPAAESTAAPVEEAATDTGPDPKTLQPFQANDNVGEVPDLPKRIAWANTSNAEFFLAITNS
ncbi:MAG TPA: twin-arginine translocation signal domain-containing protein, partial [Caldilineaceae bacterium]|nr:twin-arginine translocation signal domain-containing protein [Caldilineaceae bacterium]